MKKRILSLMLMLAVVVSTAVVPVTVQADTLSDTAAMYADKLAEYLEINKDRKSYLKYKFALAYIDEDNIPELIVSYTYGLGGEINYYFVSGSSLISGATDSVYGTIDFAPRHNLILYELLRQGASDNIFYQWTGTAIKQIGEYTHNWNELSSVDDISNTRINNIPVNTDYYTEQLNSLKNKYTWYTFEQSNAFDITTSNIADMKENPTKYILGSKPITIYLNNEEIEFDQEPINMDDNLMVPIRAIAEAMGKTVLWSDEYKAAFIDNTDNALIIPVEDNNTLNAYEQKAIFIADDGGYYSWERKQTNVQPMTLNGRTLVPIRQFAEALGADVEWVEEEQAAYITYDDTSSGTMDDTLYDSINLNYYIGRYTGNPFTKYTTNVIQAFYDSRNQTVDALAMGISSSGDVVSDLWEMYLYDETNASMALQQTLYDVINEIPDGSTDVYEADISLEKDIKTYATTAKKIYDEATGIDEDFLKAHSTLKYLNDTIKNLGDLFDFTAFTVEEIAYLLSDYSTNIGYLDALEAAFKDAYGIDYANSDLMRAVEALKKQYTNEFYQVVKDLHSEVINKTFSTALSTVTGGTYGIGKTIWKTIFKTTGVTSKGSALETFYGIYCYNLGLDSAFNTAVVNAKMNSGSTAPDLTYIKSLIELEIATKKVAIDSIADTANFWVKDDEEAAAEQLKAELDAFTYYVWDEPSYGSGGGGGGSW